MSAATELAAVEAQIAALDTQIQAKIDSGGVSSFSRGGRSVTTASLAELIQAMNRLTERRDRLSREVNKKPLVSRGVPL